MMNSERYVIDNHLADVITQSFGTGEGAFHDGSASIGQLRRTFADAQVKGVTVFAASGDGGTTNSLKEPVSNPRTIPYPSVGWPASDPLVTSVGGTYLRTNPQTGIGIDAVSPPVNCQTDPPAREIGWIASGGGYSNVFARPDYQDLLPPGSTYTGTSPGAPPPNENMRGVPDVAYEASARTGVLVYLTESSVGPAPRRRSGPASSRSPTRWPVATSGSSTPRSTRSPTTRRATRRTSTTSGAGCNQTTAIPGYCSSPGWDALTGPGTPDAARLLPDLIAQTGG